LLWPLQVWPPLLQVLSLLLSPLLSVAAAAAPAAGIAVESAQAQGRLSRPFDVLVEVGRPQ